MRSPMASAIDLVAAGDHQAIANYIANSLEMRAENEFLWTWIDRLARGELSQSECLNTITHRPGAPSWVLKYKMPTPLHSPDTTAAGPE